MDSPASSTIPDDPENESTDQLKTFLATESNKLTLPDVNVMLEILTQRKLLLETESVAAQNRLLHEFLQLLLRKTETQQQQLEKKIRLIKNDTKIVEGILKKVQSSIPTIAELDNMDHLDKDESIKRDNVKAIRDEMKQIISEIDLAMPKPGTSSNVVNENLEEGFNVYDLKAESASASSYQLRKQRMFAHFDDFVKCYFSNRSEDLHLQVSLHCPSFNSVDS